MEDDLAKQGVNTGTPSIYYVMQGMELIYPSSDGVCFCIFVRPYFLFNLNLPVTDKKKKKLAQPQHLAVKSRGPLKLKM